MTTINAVGTSLSGQSGTGEFVGNISPVFQTSLTIDNLRMAGNTISSINTNGNINLIPNGTGMFNVGTSTSLNASLMTLAENGLPASLSIGAFINNASGPTLYFVKSRNTTVGGNTAVQSNDALMTLTSYSSDGTSIIQNAEILVLATGTISTGVVPTEMLFQTTNSSGVLTTGLTIDSSQNLTSPGSLTLSQTLGLIGTTTNNDAAAGSVGEFGSNVVTFASPGSISTNSATNLTSLVLQPGDYDVWALIGYYDASTNAVLTNCRASISTSSNTLPALELQTALSFPAGTIPFTGGALTMNAVPTRVTVANSTTTTVYAVAFANFSVSATLSIFGGLYWRRRR